MSLARAKFSPIHIPYFLVRALVRLLECIQETKDKNSLLDWWVVHNFRDGFEWTSAIMGFMDLVNASTTILHLILATDGYRKPMEARTWCMPIDPKQLRIFEISLSLTIKRRGAFSHLDSSSFSFFSRVFLLPFSFHATSTQLTSPLPLFIRSLFRRLFVIFDHPLLLYLHP